MKSDFITIYSLVLERIPKWKKSDRLAKRYKPILIVITAPNNVTNCLCFELYFCKCNNKVMLVQNTTCKYLACRHFYNYHLPWYSLKTVMIHQFCFILLKWQANEYHLVHVIIILHTASHELQEIMLRSVNHLPRFIARSNVNYLNFFPPETRKTTRPSYLFRFSSSDSLRKSSIWGRKNVVGIFTWTSVQVRKKCNVVQTRM